MLKKILFCFIFILIVIFYPIDKLYAYELFFDDFDYVNNNWTYVANGGTINFSGGVMELTSNVKLFPFVSNSSAYLLNDEEDVKIEFKFNYKYVDYMGNGIGVGYTSSTGYPYYQFSIWNDLTSGPVMQYQDKIIQPDGSCNYTSGLKKISLAGKITPDSWHIFKVSKEDSLYKIYFDNELLLTTPENQCIPRNIMIGNPLSGGRTWWTKLNVDYVKIYSNLIKNNKTILLPGLGASWNPQAILFNNTSPENQWSMTPFVKNYDILIKGLENNGLERGKDYYVWNYDWRKPLSQIVDDFNSYVLSLNLTEGEKINLVGHSLGGLVSRIWSQDNANVVDKVITLGSPHYGSVKAYEAWNGAKISDNLDVASVALNVLLQLQKKNYDTGVQTLRNYAPIVYDLIPTFSFLKRNGTVVLGNSSVYLKNKNLSTSLISGQLSTLNALGVPTKEWLSLGDRSLFDKVLGIWEDGRPISYSNGEGDGTVLKKSSLINGSEIVDFYSDHGAIVDKSTNWILTKLGLGLTLAQESSYPQKQSIFYVYSPASVEIKCNGILQEEREDWVVANDTELKDCNISLNGGSGGNYKIVAGDSNKWQYFEGDIQEGQNIVLGVSEMETNWQLLKQNLIDIGASQALVAANQGNILLTIDEYVKYRMISKNFKNSEEILERLKYLLSQNSYTQIQINNMYNMALSAKSLVETNLRLMAKKGITPSYSSALNNEQALGMMTHGKNYAANYISYKLYGIVWK